MNKKILCLLLVFMQLGCGMQRMIVIEEEKDIILGRSAKKDNFDMYLIIKDSTYVPYKDYTLKPGDTIVYNLHKHWVEYVRIYDKWVDCPGFYWLILNHITDKPSPIIPCKCN